MIDRREFLKFLGLGMTTIALSGSDGKIAKFAIPEESLPAFKETGEIKGFMIPEGMHADYQDLGPVFLQFGRSKTKYQANSALFISETHTAEFMDPDLHEEIPVPIKTGMSGTLEAWFPERLAKKIQRLKTIVPIRMGAELMSDSFLFLNPAFDSIVKYSNPHGGAPIYRFSFKLLLKEKGRNKGCFMICNPK